jgi:hypothetical protein
MKVIRLVLICVFAIATMSAQEKAEVPPDVNYKAATDAVNDLAKAELIKAFSGDKAATKQMLTDSLTCGPMLWQDIQPSAERSLVNSRKIIAMLGVPVARPVEGRGFDDQETRQSFWKDLMAKYPQLGSPTTKIRKAKAWEISYFWATVPFQDIEEPFFAIEAGPQVFVANMRVFDGKPSLFWIDRVATYNELHDQPQDATKR